MEGYLLFLLVFCTVTDFSAAEKARGVKFCTRVGLLSGQVFSPFGEHWLAGSHGGGGISRAGRQTMHRECFPTAATVAGHWKLGAAALLKAAWWGMRLASLLTHLF